ncbi:MAG: dihydropyrimidinase [Planctomycetes bacterium]|nr:dihydropyrimidinase [Planctomycetota bacterium]
MRTLIKGGTVVTCAETFKADVVVEGERIDAIGAAFSGHFDKTIDATGKYLMPGALDVHTHLDMPFGGSSSSDDFETGTRAALWGGTTTVVDFAIQAKGQALRQGLDNWHAKAQGKACSDYSFHLICTDLPENVIGEMDKVVDEGVTSFKLFMAYPGVLMVDDSTIYRALLQARENGALVCMHAENGGAIDVMIKQAVAAGKTEPKWHALTRPPQMEAEATHRALAMAEVAGVPLYIVHLSAAEAMQEVRRARDRGVKAYAETCPQYLFLSYDNYLEPGFAGAKYVMSPPLRPKGNEEHLWKALALGDLQAVSTDHCPFNMSGQKELGKESFAKIPNGAPGIETRLLLLYNGGVNTGLISLNRFVELVSTNPARMFGLYPKKGTILPGADADILIWDPKKQVTISAATHHMRVDYNPYEGWKVVGAPATVLLRGKVMLENGTFTGKAGDGRFVKRYRPEFKSP